MPKSINIDIGFFTHPKTVRLTTLAGTGSEARLIQLWCYVAEHRPDTGGFDDWRPEEVEAAGHWSGEKGLFVESLLKCGWIHQRDNDGIIGFFMHDWKDHQPHLVKHAKVSKERRKAAMGMWDRKKKRGKFNDDKGKEGDANEMQNETFACANSRFCNANAVQCNAMQCNIYTPLSPAQLSEAANRIADHYAKAAKPKALDKSGSRKVFLETLRRILTKGTLEECLIASIDNYADSVQATEKSEDDVKYRHGLQTFFGPKNEHWKDYVVLPEGTSFRLRTNAFVESVEPALEAWAEEAMAKGEI